jgi:ABC-type uncharacterized transport system substrate-binding protein
MRTVLTLILTCLTAAPLAAHPHIFIEAGFELILDEAGQMTHVRVSWQYDDFYSLLITEDMAMDSDGDGVLTEQEVATLTGFDMKWDENFNGDLMMTVSDNLVALSRPREATASFAEGRITTTHLRALEVPLVPGKALIMKAYDPTYYSAYEVTGPVAVTGGGVCHVRQKAPDLDTNLMALQEQLATLDAQTDPQDAGMPDIGAKMAGSVIVICGAS